MGHWDTWDTYSNSDRAAMEFLEKRQIRVLYANLKYPVRGAYLWQPGARPLILLDYSLKNDPVLKRSILWEEIAHHELSTPDMRRKAFVLYNTAAVRDDQPLERQALRWAAKKLISTLEIRWFVSEGSGTLDEFARRFRVTSELASERLNVLQTENLSLWTRVLDCIEDKPKQPVFQIGNKTFTYSNPAPGARVLG